VDTICKLDRDVGRVHMCSCKFDIRFAPGVWGKIYERREAVLLGM